MDNFNDLIKQKVEQFDPPYNETHWVELEGKLNSIRSARIKKNIFSSAAIITVLAISSYFIFSGNENTVVEKNNSVLDKNTTEIFAENEIVTENENSKIIDNLTNENVINEKPSVEENKVDVAIEESDNKNKIVNNTNLITEEENNVNDKINPANNVADASFIVYNNKVCSSEEVSFEANEKTLPVSYKWDFGDGSESTKQNPTHHYKKSGKYNVTLTLINRKTGVETSTQQNEIVIILPLPEVTFTYFEESKKYDDNALKYPYTSFQVKDAKKKTEYKWDFGNHETATSENPKTIFKKKGSYTVTLIATNSYGCEDKTTKKVTIKNNAELIVQDAFTPNTVDGDNDVFIPVALLEWDVQFEMVIYNKSNKVVYKTIDRSNPWNGRLNNNGSMLKPGIYFWQVTTYDASMKARQQIGRIRLME